MKQTQGAWQTEIILPQQTARLLNTRRLTEITRAENILQFSLLGLALHLMLKTYQSTHGKHEFCEFFAATNWGGLILTST